MRIFAALRSRHTFVVAADKGTFTDRGAIRAEIGGWDALAAATCFLGCADVSTNAAANAARVNAYVAAANLPGLTAFRTADALCRAGNTRPSLSSKQTATVGHTGDRWFRTREITQVTGAATGLPCGLAVPIRPAAGVRALWEGLATAQAITGHKATNAVSGIILMPVASRWRDAGDVRVLRITRRNVTHCDLFPARRVAKCIRFAPAVLSPPPSPLLLLLVLGCFCLEPGKRRQAER